MSRDHIITAARVLMRTFDAAPDPRQRAWAIVRLVEDASGLQAHEQEELDSLRLWLDTRPAPNLLRARCRRLLEALQ